MKKAILYCLPLLFSGLCSCKDKPQSNIIIVHPPVAARQQKPQAIGDGTHSDNISWVGSRYTVKVSTKCDTSLPLASDGAAKYYDNRVNISILRSDGTSFFNRTFTKSDFKPYVDDNYYKDGALIGIVFDKVEGESLKFAVSVGNPDKTTDEFVPLELSVSHLGGIAIAKVETESD